MWAYLEHIAQEDTSGRRLRSVREFNPDALSIARERDWERANGRIRGVLHGIPIMLKDSIDTGDKMHTTCGSLALKDHYAAEDAFLVKRLREAGAVILGKNNLSEFYGFTSMSAPNCYSGILNGSPVNPFSTELHPLKAGGSSGGSAVSVAADFTAASIGTDTAGSIYEPACFNGVVGYKPTVGLVSRTGVLPVVMCQDVPGPITRCVRDAALIANVIIARDENDHETFRAEELRGIDLTEGLNDADLNGKRLGIVREGYMDMLKEDERAVIENAAERFKNAGAEIVEVEGFIHAQTVAHPNKYKERLDDKVMCDGFKVRLDYYLSRQQDLPFNNLKGLLEWNRQHPECIPIGQDYLEYIEDREDPIKNTEFIKARLNDIDICKTRGIDGALEKYKLDALILPGVSAQGIPATAGNPLISIPAGLSQSGAPVGINLAGAMMKDHELLIIAAACEGLLPKRPIPW